MPRPHSPFEANTTPLTLTTTRSSSPLHFLNPAAIYASTHSSLSQSSSHHSSSPAHHTSAKAKSSERKRRRHSADVSRLLDPSYMPSSSRSASASVSVYIDPHGDLHDPDYRHFPAVASPSAHSHHSGASHQGHYASHHGYNHNHPAHRRPTSPQRPHFDWELALDESALDDEYPEDEEDLLAHGHYNHNHTHHNQYNPRRNLSPRRPRESSFSTTTTMRTGYAYSGSGNYYSPTGTASTLPTSCEDEVSPFEVEREKEKERERAVEEALERERKEEGKRTRRRLSKGDKEKKATRDEEKAVVAPVRRVSFEEHGYIPTTGFGEARERDEPREEDAREENEEDADADGDERGEYVPSCTQSLRRQWQAFALSVRFGVFRAKRRVARRVQSLL